MPDGSTYRTDDSDFLVSDNLDFHPTDVVEDADGSLLVARHRRLVQALLPHVAAGESRT